MDCDPYDVIREVDRRKRDEHFALMKEEDEIKELEKQYESLCISTKELESQEKSLKLELSEVTARGEAIAAERSRIRQRVENELEPALRESEKKYELLQRDKAAFLASHEEIMLDMQETQAASLSRRPRYAEQKALEEKLRFLEEEIKAKQSILDEQEVTLKKMREDRDQKWKEFVSICIQAAQAWKKNKEEKLRKKNVRSVSVSPFVSAVSLRKSILPLKFNPYGSTPSDPRFLTRLNPYRNPHLPWSPPGPGESFRPSGNTLEEKMVEVNAKYQETMEKLRAMRMKSAEVPMIPAKKPRASEMNSLVSAPKFITPRVAEVEDMEVAAVSFEKQAGTGETMRDLIPRANSGAPSRASSNSVTSTGFVADVSTSLRVETDECQFASGSPIVDNFHAFVQPPAKTIQIVSDKSAGQISVGNTVVKSITHYATSHSRAPQLSSKIVFPGFRKNADVAAPTKDFSISQVSGISSLTTISSSQRSVETVNSNAATSQFPGENSTQDQPSNSSSAATSPLGPAEATSFSWNNEAANGSEGGDVFQFNENFDGNFNFGDGESNGDGADNNPFSFQMDTFSPEDRRMF